MKLQTFCQLHVKVELAMASLHPLYQKNADRNPESEERDRDFIICFGSLITSQEPHSFIVQMLATTISIKTAGSMNHQHNPHSITTLFTDCDTLQLEKAHGHRLW